MGANYLNRKLCPCCGQDIVIANEITSLNIPGREKYILCKLYRSKGQIVAQHVLKDGLITTSLQVHISRLRTSMKDAGLPYKIVTHSGEGYSLEDLV